MIRYKIMGPDSFHKNTAPPQIFINTCLGHFSIGSNDPLDIVFEDVAMPTKQLWVKAQMEFSHFENIAVLRKDGQSFAWSNSELCEKVSVTPVQILKAEPNWQLKPNVFVHEFGVAPTIHGDCTGVINLWPCGGKISGDLSKIEQLYAQSSGTEMYMNSLSALQKHPNDAFVFQSPEPQKLSLAGAISSGLMTVNIDDYLYTSCAWENPDNDNKFIQILFERKDQ